MDKKAFALNLLICAIIGGLIAYCTLAKWLAASLWVFAALFINGSLAFYEDGQRDGFDNPMGDITPPYAKGFGAIKFWSVSVLVAIAAVAAGVYVQFKL